MTGRKDNKLLDRMEGIANDAAVQFADAYYLSMSRDRSKLLDFYLPPTTDPEGRTTPQILWQGHALDDPLEFSQTVQQDFPFTFYHVGGVDCHVTNSCYLSEAERSAANISEAENISFLVQVSGYVRLNERLKGAVREFSESFVLVRNVGYVAGSGSGSGKDAGTGAVGAGKRKWLIQNQCCRFVASHAEGSELGKEMDIG